MHPVIHLALKKYAEQRFGPAAWDQALRDAGLGTALPYVRVGQYSDEELAAIVAALAATRQLAVARVLEEFGVATAPDLIAMYPRLIRPEWRSLDLICNTEMAIHTIVRERNPGANPAYIRCERRTPTSAQVIYHSPRRLCAFASGIVRGVARHYGEVLSIDEPTCMLRGDEKCILDIRLEN
jgi:hypothetical protein